MGYFITLERRFVTMLNNLSRLGDFRKIYQKIDDLDNKITKLIRNTNVHLYKINNRWGVHNTNKDIAFEDLEKYKDKIISYPTPEQMHKFIKDNTSFKYGYWQHGVSIEKTITTHELSSIIDKHNSIIVKFIDENIDKFKLLDEIVTGNITGKQCNNFKLLKFYFLTEKQLFFFLFAFPCIFREENKTEKLLEIKFFITVNYKKDINLLELIRNYS